MQLCIKHFRELTLQELYDIIRLREQVFVVEQNCVYLDADGKDENAYHVFLRDANGLQAYLRVLDRGVSFEAASIGRVIAVQRRQGLGTQVLQAGIRVAREQFAADRITIEAQTYARAFYEKQGFVQTSEEFLEDGIPHVRMELSLTNGAG